MKTFDYERPATLAEACSLLGNSSLRTKVLAGGTDVLVELRRKNARTPDCLVDISAIAELRGISLSGKGISIGALTTHSELVDSPILRKHVPLLPEAAETIGAVQIRNRGTMGGNIMNAATCADTVPPLIALNAAVVLRSVRGERELPLVDLYTEPYRTATTPDELLTTVRFDKPVAGTKGAFIKLGRRNALAISRLSVACLIRQDSAGVIEDIHLVPGAATPTWARMTDAENILRGKRPTKALIEEAGRSVSASMIRVTGRRWSTAYKEPVIATLAERAIIRCCKKFF